MRGAVIDLDGKEYVIKPYKGLGTFDRAAHEESLEEIKRWNERWAKLSREEENQLSVEAEDEAYQEQLKG